MAEPVDFARGSSRALGDSGEAVDEEEVALQDMLFGPSQVSWGKESSDLPTFDFSGAFGVSGDDDASDEADNVPTDRGHAIQSSVELPRGKRVKQAVSNSDDEDDDDASVGADGHDGAAVSHTVGGEAEKDALWEDEDDNKVSVRTTEAHRLRRLRESHDEDVLQGKQYQHRLRKQFKKIYGDDRWAVEAEKAQTEEESKGGGNTVGNASITSARNGRVSAGALDIVRMTNANAAEPSRAVVQSIAFHPDAPIVMTAGLDKTMRLFQVDGAENPKLQSVHLADLPIHTASFTPDGKELIASGRRKHFYTVDVATTTVHRVDNLIGRDERSLEQHFVTPDNKHVCFIGKAGNLLFTSRQTKQWAYTLRMNALARDVAFADDGVTMYSCGGDGLVYVWDLRMRKCKHVFHDEGALTCTSISANLRSSRLAVGSDAGVVNIYDTDALLSTEAPKPVNTLMQLTTTITHASYNHDGQLFAFASRRKKEAMRVVHAASGTVFANWPTTRTPLHYVSSVAFSPHSGFIAVGNDKGHALLYRLNSFGAA